MYYVYYLFPIQISKNLATTCPNLTTLYMQANQIQKIMDMKPLANIKKLKKLVLFGTYVCIYLYMSKLVSACDFSSFVSL